MRRLRPIVLVLLALIPLAGCRRQAPEGEVWFVHVTDPHLFYDSITEKWDDRVRNHQEKLNQEAFSALIDSLDGLPGPDPAFLVVSGDFGLDRFAAELQGPTATPATPAATATPTPTPPSTPAPESTPAPTPAPTTTPAPTATPAPTPGPAASANVDSAVKYLVSVLGRSRVKDIYLVPGNNDVGGEAADGKPVEAVQSFWNRVQDGLKDTGVTLHDLTSCYFHDGLPSGCYAEVQRTSYWLVGFPSQSFKNGVDDARSKVQQAQLEKLGSLVSEVAAKGKRVLIVTHIPEIDDPHVLAENDMKLARELASADEKAKWSPDRPEWAASSPWNMRRAAFDKWREIMGQQAVAGVLAGHFHDSHKEIYRPPYDWATSSAERANLDKLYLAPPLSMRFQDESPIQARGFALFRLRDGDDPERTLFWYDRKQRTFQADQPVGGGSEQAPRGSFRSTASEASAWLWSLGTDKEKLGRAVVFAIALLAAFLTVVEVWQIPPPNTRPVTVARESQLSENGTVVQTRTEVEAGKGQAATYYTYGSTALLFQTNFARTVLSGLAGLALVSAFDGLWRDLGIQEKPYFLVLFVLFFLFFLFVSALFRGVIEAVRSRVALSRKMPGEIKPAWKYWVKRFWFWALSMRTAFLCLFDTFFNVIQGKNQLHTVEFENEIARLHESIVGGIDRVRQDLDLAFQEALERRKKAEDERRKKEGVKGSAEGGASGAEPPPASAAEYPWKAPRPKPADVRVNISLLSEDESTVFYVSREEGSLAKSFGKSSVAWVALFNSRALWWKDTYEKRNIVLIEDKGGPPLYLADHYEPRTSPDYKGFVILPVPWGRRAEDEGRKAGIHISFRQADYMDWLWKGLDPYPPPGKEAQSEQPAPAGAADQNKPPKDSLYNGWPGLIEFRDDDGQGPCLHDRELSKVLRRSVLLLTELVQHFNDDVFEEYIRPRTRPQ